MTHTITFGDDGSAGSDLAWSWICDQDWSGWDVEVVRAVQPELGPPPPPALSQLHSWQPERPRERFSESHLGSIVHLTAVQDPRLLLSRPADLLVIGARGPGIAKALRLGSTAEWLLESPPGPMVDRKSVV